MEQVFKLRSFSGGLGNGRLGRCWLAVCVRCLGLEGLVVRPRPRPRMMKGVVLIGLLGGSLQLSATEWFIRGKARWRVFRRLGCLLRVGVGCDIGSVNERFNSHSFYGVRVASSIEFKLDNLFGIKCRLRDGLVKTL